MRQTVDVFILILGKPPDHPDSVGSLNLPVDLRLISTEPKSDSDLTEALLPSHLAEGDSDLVAVVAGSSEATLRTAAMLAGRMATDWAAAFSIDRIDAGFRLDPTGMPGTDFRIIIAARAHHGPVVFRREKLQQIGPLRPVSEPVWDWLIRAVLGGEKINVSPDTDLSKSDFSRLPLLAPPLRGPESNWLREHLASITPEQLRRAPNLKPMTNVDEIAVRAALFQWHDFLDESHELSQSIEGQGEHQLGDYWHAIMHRREPDYSNAKYWFRRLGNQPTYRDLRLHADTVLSECRAPQAAVWRDRLQSGDKWNPMVFVDLCEGCATDETSELAIAARRIQFAEMCLLMCHR
jgi:hypothetical protein